jgi:hypothetical protein
VRIAGNSSGYAFRLVRETDEGTVLTDHGFELVSVTTFLKEVLATPPAAMGYWGFRVALKAIVQELALDPGVVINADTPELLEAALKEKGISPNLSRDAAGQRGHAAHTVLECMATYQRISALMYAEEEEKEFGTHYGDAAIAFWDEQVQPNIDSGQILQVLSEVPVWSLKHGYCGTLDLAIQWAAESEYLASEGGGWEILDAKTHKPAKGFTLEGRGCGYDSDAAQCRAYRIAFEEMGLGKTIGQRTVVLRENGKYLTDDREVSEGMVISLRRLYDERLRYEGKLVG